MISFREWSAFALALVVVLTTGNLPLSLITFLAAWLVQIKRPDTRSAERRYRMRETERRNLTKM